MTLTFLARQAQGLRSAGKLGKNRLISNPIVMEKIRAHFPGGLVKWLIQICLLVLILLLSACAAPRQAFNKDLARDLRTVAVTDHAKDEYFWVSIVNHPLGIPNLIGALSATADLWAKSAKVTTALDPKQTRVQNRLSKRLAEGLNICGYDAEVITFDEPARLDDALKLASQRSKADAVIAVRVDVSYVATSWYSDSLLSG